MSGERRTKLPVGDVHDGRNVRRWGQEGSDGGWAVSKPGDKEAEEDSSGSRSTIATLQGCRKVSDNTGQQQVWWSCIICWDLQGDPEKQSVGAQEG